MSEEIGRLWRRVLLLVGRARIKTVVDGGNVQVMQVQLGADEISDEVPRLAEYGFQSSPPPDSDAVLVFLAGERSNGVVIACGNKTYRMKGLATGEVAISDDKGQKVYLSAAGIRIDGGGLPITVSNSTHVTIDSPLVEMTGNVLVGGNLVAVGDVADQNGTKTMAGMRTTFNVHQHGSSVTPTPTM